MRAIYVDGKAQNLEAAANDALTWLEWLAEQDRKDRCRLSGNDRLALAETIATLRRCKSSEEPEFVETTAA
jgi:hypothetical protein